MPYTKLCAIAILLALTSCKKELPEEPINTVENNVGLDCATCPSIFHPFADLIAENIETCDDFTDTDIYPSEIIFSEEIIGYTQDATESITMLEGGFVQINGADTEPGFYGASSLVFTFDGTEQTATFMAYGSLETFDEMGLSINGTSIIYYNESFPYTFGEITIDIDLSIPDIGSWEAFEITIVGEIESITQVLFESGITELCVSKSIELEPPLIDKNHYIYFDNFYNYDGSILGSYPNRKTPLGYYGLQATNLVIHFEEFLGYDPTRISFVHAYDADANQLVNIQLPNTPLIATIPDSLNYFLAPYGYGVEHYFKTDAQLWFDQSSPPLTENVLDSIIITGNNLNAITLGANLQASELRSICTYYEQ